MKKVLLAKPYSAVVTQIISDALKNEAEVILLPDPDEQTLLKAADQVDVLISGTFVTRRIIENCSSLKAIATVSVGYDKIDVEAVAEKGIYVINAAGSNSRSVAEYVMGFMLALSRKLVYSDHVQRIDRSWAERAHIFGSDLGGKTIGIIGMGQIGQKIAKICAHGFEMTVLGYDPYKKDEFFTRLGLERTSELNELFSRSDFVSLNCNYTPELKGLVNKEKFDLMKPTAYLINCARGPLVNQKDLAEALISGRIAGAGIDVYEEEPPEKEDPLFGCPNLIATGHVAANTMQSLENAARMVSEDVLRALRGEKPVNLVN